MLFQLERIVAVVQVVLKIVPRPHFQQNVLLSYFRAVEYVLQRDAGQVALCLQVDVFAERESVEHVVVADSVQFVIFVVGTFHGGCTIDDMQTGKAVVTFAQFFLPAVLLEYLVNDEYLASTFHKFLGEVHDAAPLEIETVHVNVEAAPHVNIEILLGILEKKGCFAYTTWSFDANQPVTPVDFVHQGTRHCSVRMLN